MCGAFHMLNGDDVVALLSRIARHIVEGFTLCKQYFEDIARL